MSKLCFPPLRIVEEKMTNKEILETFNTAFGGEAVVKVVKSKNTRIIHINQENEAHENEWKNFYDALNKSGAVWIKAKYLGDGVYHNCFDYSLYPETGYWEVRYANPRNIRVALQVKEEVKEVLKEVLKEVKDIEPATQPKFKWVWSKDYKVQRMVRVLEEYSQRCIPSNHKYNFHHALVDIADRFSPSEDKSISHCNTDYFHNSKY